MNGRGTRTRRALIAIVVAAVVTGGGYALDAAAGDEPEALGPGVVTLEVDIEHSRFSLPADLRVRPGTVVRFVVRNDDPIHHELIVGPSEVHALHAVGTDHRHPPVPGEVSVGPNETGVTFYRFDEPGTVRYACHLPGHVAYGMEGEISVVDG